MNWRFVRGGDGTDSGRSGSSWACCALLQEASSSSVSWNTAAWTESSSSSWLCRLQGLLCSSMFLFFLPLPSPFNSVCLIITVFAIQ